MSGARARHPWRTLTIVVVVLAALLVAADRIALAVSEDIAATAIQRSEHLPQRPDVTVDGVPFLTQLAASSYGEVTVSSRQVPVGQGDRQTTLDALTVTLHDVDTSRNFDHIHAATTTATGALGYAQLRRVTGVDVAWAGNGRVRATASETVFGHTVSGTVSARPLLRGDALAFTDVQVGDAGTPVGDATRALGALFDVTVPLSGLPFGLRVTELTVGAGGVEFGLAGQDVTLDTTST